MESRKITKTTEIKAGVNAVNFPSQGANLAGLLFTPADFDAAKNTLRLYSQVHFYK